MNVKTIQPIISNNGRRLIPLSQYKGPKLDLMFYEIDEIKVLQKELQRMKVWILNFMFILTEAAEVSLKTWMPHRRSLQVLC